MPSITRSTPETASPEARRRASIRAASEFNYTAQRVLRAQELVVMNPSTAPAVAAALGINARTARRILRTLTIEGYVERRPARGREAYEYQATVRLLALAAQLASRLPLVAAARRAVRVVEEETDGAAYVAVPCYADILVLAASGARAIRPWATVPASADAAGWVLLAHRAPWRDSLRDVEPSLAVDDVRAAAIVERGYAELPGPGGRSSSLAVVVPSQSPPIAALGVRSMGADLTDLPRTVIGILERAAARLAAESQSVRGP